MKSIQKLSGISGETEFKLVEGNAIIYCDEAFDTPNGKTTHGLVRRTDRYNVLSVVDSRFPGRDAGKLLNGLKNGIPIWPDIDTAFFMAKESGVEPTHLVIGLAPDGGNLSEKSRQAILQGINLGLNIDSGLHSFLNDDFELVEAAKKNAVWLRDIRKSPNRNKLHFFSGKIKKVMSKRIAILGTDSAVGKRTTGFILNEALNEIGYNTEFIGTGQTSWLQGVKYGIIMDSLINDFVAGEIEHVIWRAWKEVNPDVMILEGQGSLLNPAYPGGFELLAAGRPDAVILQHAPLRIFYDGFPGYRIHPIEKQIKAIELLSGKPVVAIAVNHEGIKPENIDLETERLAKLNNIPCVDVLTQGASGLIKAIRKFLPPIREYHEE